MTKLVYVTGVSCAGKTTLGRELDRFPEVKAWWDLDENAYERPRTAWLDWLRWRAAEYLVEATERAEPDDDSLLVVTGIVWPFRVIESPAWDAAERCDDLSIEWLMLDPPWKTLRRRLDDRTAGKPKGERAELRRYNRGLRSVIRTQVDAVRQGYRWTRGNLDGLARITVTDEGWGS